jgi:hypothetical protein
MVLMAEDLQFSISLHSPSAVRMWLQKHDRPLRQQVRSTSTRTSRQQEDLCKQDHLREVIRMEREQPGLTPYLGLQSESEATPY